MKKAIVILMIICLVVCTCLPAFAVSTTGPKKYATLVDNVKKEDSDAEPKLSISSVSIGGSGFYHFWIRDKKSDNQVSYSYKFTSSDTGARKIYYSAKYKGGQYVKAGRYYDARVKSNEKVGKNETGTIEASSFAP